MFFGHPWAINRSEIGSIFIPNTAMNASLNLVLLPFSIWLIPEAWPITLFLVLILTLTAKSSTAFLCMLLMFYAMIHQSEAYKKVKIMIYIISGLVASLLAYRYMPGFLNGGNRFDSYKLFFLDFTFKDWIIGKGPGSFQEWSALIQYAYDFKLGDGFNLFMHSDPLQLIWEMGSIGFILAMVPVYHLLKKAEFPVFLSLVAFFVSSFLYYPFHVSVPLVVFFLLVKLVTIEPTKYQ